MYIKRVQIINYGPIDHLEIDFPLENDFPKPVLIVGENGSGKSLLLSHIANGLNLCKDTVYPNTPEVETNKVYKLRSSSYIKTGREFYFAKLDFEDNLFFEEMRLARPKQEYSALPELISEEAENTWTKIQSGGIEHIYTNSYRQSERKKIESIFSKNCVLYFPSNRFEEPAWLNRENLTAKAKYMGESAVKGSTIRKFINYSPLWDNQNWLFDVHYDMRVFELQVQSRQFAENQERLYPVFSGKATNVCEIALQIVRCAMKGNENIRFAIGERRNRILSIMEDDKAIVPNIFHLSSGETSLLNLFLSILRDFEQAGTNSPTLGYTRRGG